MEREKIPPSVQTLVRRFVRRDFVSRDFVSRDFVSRDFVSRDSASLGKFRKQNHVEFEVTSG